MRTRDQVRLAHHHLRILRRCAAEQRKGQHRVPHHLSLLLPARPSLSTLLFFCARPLPFNEHTGAVREDRRGDSA